MDVHSELSRHVPAEQIRTHALAVTRRLGQWRIHGGGLKGAARTALKQTQLSSDETTF